MGQAARHGHTNGHRAAEPVVFDTIAGAIEAGVRYLSLYTFSTENWKRSPQEVRFLMGFSREIIHRRVEQMDEWGARRWSGRRPKLWKSVIDELEAAEERTKNNKVIDVVFCINYGGRAEIADACAAIAREVRDGKISGDRVTEDDCRPSVQSGHSRLRLGDPYFRRTRTSNFLPWRPPTPSSTSCPNSSRTAAVTCYGAPSTITSTAIADSAV